MGGKVKRKWLASVDNHQIGNSDLAVVRHNGLVVRKAVRYHQDSKSAADTHLILCFTDDMDCSWRMHFGW